MNALTTTTKPPAERLRPALRRVLATGALLLAPVSANAQLLPEPGALPEPDFLPGPVEIPAPPLTEQEYYYLYLDLNLKLEQFDEAERVADLLLARNPRDPQGLAAKTTMVIKRGEAANALRYAERLRSVSPGPDAEIAMVAALNLNRRFEEALEILNKLKAKTPAGELFPYQLDFGYTYYGMQDLMKARSTFFAIYSEKRYPPKQREEAFKQLANIERDLDLLRAYEAIDQRDLRVARAIADQLEGDPGKENRELTILKAILDAEQFGKTDEAIAVLERLRDTTPRGKEFPYYGVYANQLIDQGRYAEAEAAAEKAASLKVSFTDEEYAATRLDTLRQVRPYTRSSVTLDVRYEDRAEGIATRYGAKGSVPLHGAKTRLGAEFTYHTLDLEDAIAGGADEEYHAAYLFAKRQLTERIFATAAVGLVDGDFAYRAGLGWHRPSQDARFEITWEDGKRPTDTLQLEKLGASEKRVTVKGSREVPKARMFRVSGEAFWREIDLGGGLDSLGSGWGVRAQVEYLLYRHRRNMVSLAYVGAYETFDFSGSSAALANAFGITPGNLVEDDYHAHGLAIFGEAQVLPNLVASARLGLDYRLDTTDVVFSVSGGLSHWFADYGRLVLEAAYYTSGRAVNEASGFFEGRVGVDMTF